METAEKMELLDASLTRAAEQIGDITPSVMELFYSRYPEAKASFEALAAANNSAQLEGEMVERALFCIMYWFESPGEIEIMLSFSVPHHHDTLSINPAWYSGLIDAVVEIVTATIPPENTAEKAVWDELHAALRDIVEKSRKLFYEPHADQPAQVCPISRPH